MRTANRLEVVCPSCHTARTIAPKTRLDSLCPSCAQSARRERERADEYTDPIMVGLLVSGHYDHERVHPTMTERREAIGILTRYGHTNREIAERLHVTTRTVTRLRAELNHQQERSEA